MRMNTTDNQLSVLRMLLHEIQRCKGGVNTASKQFEWNMSQHSNKDVWDRNDDGVGNLLRRVADPEYHVRHVEHGDGPIPGQEAIGGHQTIAEIAGWSVGTVGRLKDPDDDDRCEGFHEDDPMALEHDSGTSAPLFRHVVTSKTRYLHLDQVTLDESGAEDVTLWQPGDRFEVIDAEGHPFERGQVVELVEVDHEARWRLRVFGYTIHEYRNVDGRWVASIKSRRLRRLGRSEDWQPGARFKVIDTDGGHGFDHGEVVELVTRDERSGLQIHDYRSVTTGRVAGVLPKRLHRLEPYTLTEDEMPGLGTSEDPEPAVGEVWDVVLPNVSEDRVHRLYVAELTDRVVGFRPAAFNPYRRRYEPHAGGTVDRAKRERVEFVERVREARP